jgi:hypothetical protein
LAKYEFKRNRLGESRGGENSDAVDDVLDDITDDVSDNFIELNSGEFKSKAINMTERKSLKAFTALGRSSHRGGLTAQLSTSRHKTRKIR